MKEKNDNTISKFLRDLKNSLMTLNRIRFSVNGTVPLDLIPHCNKAKNIYKYMYVANLVISAKIRQSMKNAERHNLHNVQF